MNKPLPHYSQMTSAQGQAIERAYQSRREAVDKEVESYRLDFPQFQEFMLDHGLDRDLLSALQDWINDVADSKPPHPPLYRVIMEKMRRRAEALVPEVTDGDVENEM